MQRYLPLSHRHFKYKLTVLHRHLVFRKSVHTCNDRETIPYDFDFRTCVLNAETEVEYILDRLRETMWIDDEFEEIYRGILS